MEGGGEKRNVSFSPLPLPRHSFFLLSYQRSRQTLNMAKTEFMLIGSRQRLSTLT